MLRYQLYECNEPEIPLRQELTYLEGFIELERLRIDTHNLSLSLNLTQLQAYDLTIAPFIIIPFIENAFKHVSQWRDKPNWITINLGFNNHQLHLEIINSTAADQGTLPEFLPYKGLGLKNVQRRLDLVYPSDHILLIKKDHEQFSVTLNLNLREQAKTGKQVMQAV